MYNFAVLLPQDNAGINRVSSEFYSIFLPSLEARGINVDGLSNHSMVGKAAINVVGKTAFFVDDVEELQATPQYFIGTEVKDCVNVNQVVFGKPVTKSPYDAILNAKVPMVTMDSDNGLGLTIINGHHVTYRNTPVEVKPSSGTLYAFKL